MSAEHQVGGMPSPALRDKRIVMTGVTKGIGRDSAVAFCEADARVIGVSRSLDDGVALQQELRDAGHDFTFVQGDVSLDADVDVIRSRAADLFGVVDVLVNNAGVAVGRHLLETSVEDWDRTQAVTVRGSFLMIRAIGSLMEAGGSIVNLASTGGLVALPNMAAYCASKGSVVAMTRALAVELAPGIRVNAVCPGAIDTPMSWQLYGEVPGMTSSEVAAAFASNHLVKRIGQPREVTALLAFLASDESSFVTGAALSVDGGFTTV